IVVVVASLAAVLVYSQHRPRADHVSGFIEADDVRVGSRVGGRVKTVGDREGQRVKAGELLVEFEPYDLLQRQAEARAKRAELAATLAKREAGPRKQEIAAAQAR